MKSPTDLHSPKQIALVLGVSESSLKRWCDQGLLKTTRTAGGHRKVLTSEVVRFARERGMPIVFPELLNLPPVKPNVDNSIEKYAVRLAEALLAGDEMLSSQIVFHLALGQHLPLPRIFDEVIAQAFVEIGDRWACQQADVYQERRSCEIIQRTLIELRKSQPLVTSSLTACGGTVTGNIYALQTLMAELVLRDCGFHASSLGTSIPFESFVSAIHEIRPTLFWLSAAYIADESDFLRGFTKLSEACVAVQSVLVVGGRSVTPRLRERMSDVTYIDNMQQLAGFAKNIARIHQRTLNSRTRPAE